MLDKAYMQGIGKFDIVYLLGVLYRNAMMWWGLENPISRVAERDNSSLLFARVSNASVENIVKFTLKLKPMIAIRPFLEYKKNRSMSIMHDLIDWMGGFLYEFASYEVLLQYFEIRGFALVKGVEATSLGCHEIVFQRTEYVDL